MTEDPAAITTHATPVRPEDVEAIGAQLGGRPRGLVGMGARYACGAPVITATEPRLPGDTPFPTLFYLTLPNAVYGMSRLKAEGCVAGLNACLAEDAGLTARYRTVHTDYIGRRRLLGDVSEIVNVDVGGMFNRVRCLRALAAYSTSVRGGVYLVGDLALKAVAWGPAMRRRGEGSQSAASRVQNAASGDEGGQSVLGRVE